MVKNNTALVEDQTTTSYNSSSRRSGKFSWTPWTPATHGSKYNWTMRIKDPVPAGRSLVSGAPTPGSADTEHIYFFRDTYFVVL